MKAIPNGHPTLWRTCRALANKTRLAMLIHIIRHPGLSVTQIANAFDLTLPQASMYLRILNSRGLIRAARMGRYVFYEAKPDESIPAAPAILKAIRESLANEANPAATIYGYVTAFTHPRRILIVKALCGGSLSWQALQKRVRLSKAVLARHLDKLIRRGYVVEDGRLYDASCNDGAMPGTLLRLALSGR